MTVKEIIAELEGIESSLNNNDLDEAKIDLYLLLKELLKTVTIEDEPINIEINGWNIENAFSGIKYKKNFLYKDTDLKKTVTVSSENRLGWTLKRKNTATLFKIGIPMFFLTFLVYYSVF